MRTHGSVRRKSKVGVFCRFPCRNSTPSIARAASSSKTFGTPFEKRFQHVGAALAVAWST